ncbi:hypothetical protein FQN54_006006 [Arachnomyces sp. PD_36]|nr:hypothetical protein FQN54_006006 [Arachnomyces sp. PD_36]
MSVSKTGLMARSISRRADIPRPACGDGKGNMADYDTPLHVIALLVILFVSFTACAFPLVVIKYPRLRIPSSFLFSARHFGTGVLIATAFVHLLPTAFISLSDPCLSSFWTDDYPAMPGAIALGAVFLVTVIEMVFSPGQHGHMSVPQDRVATETETTPAETSPSRGPTGTRTLKNSMGEKLRRLGPLRGRATSVGRELQRMASQANQMDEDENRGEGDSDEDVAALPDPPTTIDEKAEIEPLTEEQKHKKALLQCMLLEMGILFHSVFIGMALSVSVGGDFIMLWIAISFHQTFEGLALGSRIASLSWKSGALQPWLMALAYGCTTPIGQAIGLATHSLYDPESQTGLLLVGTMNAISAGLLIYASLVELLAEDFLSDDSWRVLRGRRRVAACCMVFLGAVLMSLVGAWA